MGQTNGAKSEVLAAEVADPADGPPVEQVVGTGDSVVLFNSLAQLREEFVEMPLRESSASTTSFKVVDAATGEAVPSTVIPALPMLASGSKNISKNISQFGGPRKAKLVFKVTIAPLTSNTYHIADAAVKSSATVWVCQNVSGRGGADGGTDLSIHGDGIAATYSGITGRMSSLAVGDTKTVWNVSQRFYQYHSSSGSNAYQFAPDRKQFPFGEPLDNTIQSDNATTSVRLCVLRTPLVERVVQSYVLTTHAPPPAPIKPAIEYETTR